MYYLDSQWIGWKIWFPNDHTMNMHYLGNNMAMRILPASDYIFTLI